MIVALNFKAFKETIGKNAIRTIKKIDKKFKKIDVIVIVNPSDVSLVSETRVKYLRIYTSLNKYCETFGAFTGSIPLEYIKDIGLDGILLNHFENRISYDLIEKFIKYCNKIRLETMVCAKDLKESKFVDKLNPTYIAFEVPELIGSGMAISKYRAESLKTFVSSVKNIPICGAGISDALDVKIARDLGVKGVLIGSSFAKSKDKLLFLKKIDKIL